MSSETDGRRGPHEKSPSAVIPIDCDCVSGVLHLHKYTQTHIHTHPSHTASCNKRGLCLFYIQSEMDISMLLLFKNWAT